MGTRCRVVACVCAVVGVCARRLCMWCVGECACAVYTGEAHREMSIAMTRRPLCVIVCDASPDDEHIHWLFAMSVIPMMP